MKPFAEELDIVSSAFKIKMGNCEGLLCQLLDVRAAKAYVLPS